MSEPMPVYAKAIQAAGAVALDIDWTEKRIVLSGRVNGLGLGGVERSQCLDAFTSQLAPADQTRFSALADAESADLRLRLVGDDHEVRFVRLIGAGDGGHWQGLLLPAGGEPRGGRAAVDLETALTRALANGDVRAHYQPVVDLKTRSLAGFEGLARWVREDEGVLGPEEFLPVAQTHGYMRAVGDQVRTCAALDLAAWRAAWPDAGQVFMAANATASEISSPDFSDRLVEQIQKAGLPPHIYKLEVSETEVMRDPESAEASLKQVQKAGLSLVLDDFGTGYSSLARLDRFPFDVVKIDQYFIRSALTDPAARSIISSVVRIAETYGMDVVAEGVETAEAERLCLEMGCNFGQGFYYARALTAQSAAHAMGHGLDNRFNPPNR